MERQIGTPEEGVSEIVGTVIVLGLVVALFSILSLTAMGFVGQSSDPPRSDIHAIQRGDQVLIVHEGGDPMPLRTLLLTRDLSGVTTQTPITDLTADFDPTDAWRLGQSICISCSFAVDQLEAYAIVLDNEFIMEVDLRV